MSTSVRAHPAADRRRRRPRTNPAGVRVGQRSPFGDRGPTFHVWEVDPDVTGVELEMIRDASLTAIIHPSTKGGPYQLTYFRDGQPTGDLQGASLRDLIRETGPGQWRLREVVARSRNPEDWAGATADDLPAVAPVAPARDTPTERGFLYHATSEDNARSIAQDGALKLHRPWEGTDQDVWPDGSRARRAYFSARADVVWAFAPEDGRPVVLRVKESSVDAHRESTGDVYVTREVPAAALEILTTTGWMPLLSMYEGA